MNIFKKWAFAFCMLMSGTMLSKTLEFVQDGYLMPATPELTALTENVAKLVDFEQAYEIAIPKKAGMQINPWNKLIAAGTNPQTKNPILIINTEWFNTLPQDQQTFLLGRNFLMLKNGVTPPVMKVIPFLSILFTIFLAFCIYRFITRTNRIGNKWVRIAITYALIAGANLAFLNALHLKVIRYLGAQHDMRTIEMVIEKTQNKQAAIDALSAVDIFIKNDLKSGERFWEPSANLFESFVDRLK